MAEDGNNPGLFRFHYFDFLILKLQSMRLQYFYGSVLNLNFKFVY